MTAVVKKITATTKKTKTPKKSTSKLTKKQMRLFLYNETIAKHKKLFKVGAFITRQQFTTMFRLEGIVSTGSYEEILHSNMKLMNAQAEINSLMKENGMILTSENYYSFFRVMSQAETKKTILTTSKRIDRNIAHVDRLTDKLVDKAKDGSWGEYTEITSSAIVAMGHNGASDRHKAICASLKSMKK